MEKKRSVYWKFLLIFCVVFFCVLNYFWWNYAKADTSDDVYGRTVIEGVHEYTWDEGTIDKGLYIDSNSTFYRPAYGPTIGYRTGQQTNDYIFSDSDGHYEMYNCELDWNSYMRKFDFKYHTDTWDWDTNGEKFTIVLTAELYEGKGCTGKLLWSKDLTHSWTDKGDQGGALDSTEINYEYDYWKSNWYYDHFEHAVYDGYAKIYVKRLVCSTH